MKPMQTPSARGDELAAAPVPLSAERQARLNALIVLNRPSDWRAAVAELGRVYLRHPELIEIELTEDASQIDAARVHELLGRAAQAAAATQRADELVTLAVLMLADGRLEAARGMIAKIVPANDAERDAVQALTRSLRARTEPNSSIGNRR